MNSQNMNNIFHRQNDERFLKLLRSSHAVYKNAKGLSVLLFAVSVIIPLSINVSFLFFDDHIVKSVLCFVALSTMLLGFILKELINRFRAIASLIQQHYDLSLFRIGRISNSEKSLIEKYIIKYGDKSFESEKNWYEDYSKCSEELAILNCQKENVNWTSRTTDRCILIIAGLLAITIIPIIIGCILFNTDIGSVFQFFYNGVPMLAYLSFALYQLILERIEFNKIKSNIDFVVELYEKHQNIRDDLLALQNAIFNYRKTKRVMPDWLYRFFYQQDSLYEAKVSELNNKEIQ